MAIYDQITRISNAKADIKAAIEAKGVSVGEGTLDTYAEKIGEIQVGNDDLIIKLVDGSLTEFDIPEGTTRIKAYLFCTNGSIKIVNIPDTVKSIGLYAFNGCGRLTSITIPDSVELIDNFAFRLCPELNEITIGNGVTNIGTQSLDIGSSSKKATIIMKPTTPPVIQSNTIGANVEKIIVPVGTGDTYKAASIWSNYASIIEEATA